jgi:hypothetical protein
VLQDVVNETPDFNCYARTDGVLYFSMGGPGLGTVSDRTCARCGTRADAGLIFCKQCGTTLRPPVPLIQPDALPPATVADAGEPINHKVDYWDTSYRRALMFGIGAALLGLVLYSAVAIVSARVSGFASLAIGYIIGKAMMQGSKGVRGRKYQITAAILTYFAIAMSFTPIVINHVMEVNHKRLADLTALRVGWLAHLLMVSILSPIYDLKYPEHGVIGLLILASGIAISWRITGGGASGWPWSFFLGLLCLQS